jgi:hypothetical protein
MTTITWKVESTTHGSGCAGCEQAIQDAIAMAKVTGSVGATQVDDRTRTSGGYHAAKVSRLPMGKQDGSIQVVIEPEWFECPYDYLMQRGTEGLVAHFAEKHPHMRDEIARLAEGELVLLRSRLQYIDRSYNGPATD